MQRAATLAVVFAGSLLFLGTDIGAAGLATNWVDPVAKIPAQDEAVYAASSLTMAESGEWLTPYFMGRYALYKPPMLYWLSSICVRAFGETRAALRFPSVVAGALTVTVVFAWVWASAPLSIAFTAALLLASSHLFFVLARLAMTDALLVCETTLAMYAVHRDPALRRAQSVWLFGAACGAAVLTKAAAGFLPIAAAAGVWMLHRETHALPRVLFASLVAAVIALPWHLYQMWVHPQWFWPEYVLQEHFTWGWNPPSQTTAESSASFYAKRLLFLDPVLVLVGGAALLRRRPAVLLWWVAVSVAAIFAYRYRNAAYLLPLMPALAVSAASAIPARFSRPALITALALAALKLTAPAETWGLPVHPESVNPSHAALDRYAGLRRPSALIVVDPDDQFYASLLHLPRLHYAYMGDLSAQPPAPLNFARLGVSMSSNDFASLPRLRPTYEARLREVGLLTSRSLASSIFVRNAEDLRTFIAANPSADFYLPRQWAGLAPHTHDSMDAPGDRSFLLARQTP